MEVKQDVCSSDSTPFADKGVPAVSFARIAPPNTATIHNRYDTMALMKGEQMVLDTDFLIAFAERMANAARCPRSPGDAGEHEGKAGHLSLPETRAEAVKAIKNRTLTVRGFLPKLRKPLKYRYLFRYDSERCS